MYVACTGEKHGVLFSTLSGQGGTFTQVGLYQEIHLDSR